MITSFVGPATMGNKHEKGSKAEKGDGGKGKSKANLKSEPSTKGASGNDRDYIFKLLTIGDQGNTFLVQFWSIAGSRSVASFACVSSL